MARKLSTPGVYRTETDVSEVVSPTGTSTGVIVGGAVQGPANARSFVGTNKEFTEKFGKPQSTWTSDFGNYASLQFLQESQALYFTRVTDGTESYAHIRTSASNVTSAVTAGVAAGLPAIATNLYTVANTSTTIKDIEDASFPSEFVVASVGPGVEGNKVAVKITTSDLISATSVYGSNTYTAGTSALITALSADVDWAFNYDDSTSAGFSNASDAIWKKVFKIDVYAEATSSDAGSITSASDGSPDETFYGTLGDLLDGNGKQLNIKTVVNGVSKYIYVDNNGLDGSVPKHTNGAPKALTGGVIGSEVGASSIVAGFDFYTDREKVDVNILIQSWVDSTTVSVANKIGSVAFGRLDCIGSVQIPSVPNQSVDSYLAKDTLSLAGPSYAAKYAGWDKVFDSFNDKNIFIPTSIFGGVIMARTDRVSDTWKAPAGINRGVLPVVDKDIRFSEIDIGRLYDNNINTSKFVKGTGHVMWGQRTSQRKVSALREIAVRRLLLFIENSIEPSVLPFLFEPNNTSNRLRVKSIIDSFLSSVSSSGGIGEFNVVVDETNNTPQVIDNNILNIDVYLQPLRAIEFIQLQIIITRTGASLTEV